MGGWSAQKFPIAAAAVMKHSISVCQETYYKMVITTNQNCQFAELKYNLKTKISKTTSNGIEIPK
jgi:hypothetical protein